MQIFNKTCTICFTFTKMLDFFSVFSKGGIVLWCYTLQGVKSNFTDPINALIKSVILQGKGGKGNAEMIYNQWKMKSKMDNEFELVFVVGYQKALTLMYVDKLIDDVHLSFRDQYRQKLLNGSLALLSTKFDYETTFAKKLKEAEKKPEEKKVMKTFSQSAKSQRTVGSMIVDKKKKDKETNNKPPTKASPKVVKENGQGTAQGSLKPESGTESPEVLRKREEFFKKQMAKSDKGAANKKTTKEKQKGKAARKWGNGGNANDVVNLDFSKETKPATNGHAALEEEVSEEQRAWVNKSSMIQDLEVEDDSSEEEEEENTGNKKQSGGFFSMFRGLVGSKALTKEALQPALSKMRDHLIAKNVAADIAEKMCDSVSNKLEGKVLGTFTRPDQSVSAVMAIASTVKQSLQESLVQILTPKRRVDILRDVLEAQRTGRPYTITFCGVNGVGKSTNLAKICFWLMENGFRVLIAACDTFRAGAVEQLVTHTARLRALHPPSMHGGKENVLLFQKGYGKDAAGIAMQAIKTAQEQRFDVVLIDTAGRMQDNEPLMRALAKLITINLPDLVLFVGEALVGNEAVDQLVKFNQALADFSKEENPRLIDGIVLTKFDTIDDKVGAAISMTYTTGQPIVFVGTGQSYPDLRSLNAKAVVHALLK